MSELAEDWQAFNEAKKKRRSAIEPSRVNYATEALIELGCVSTLRIDDSQKAILFRFKKLTGKIYPYTGWYSVKGIGNGRGIHQLVKKLKEHSND